MKRAYRWWLTQVDRFLFDGCDPIMCSVMRVTYAPLLIVYVLMWMREANLWFVDSGVLTSETAQQIGRYEYWSLLFWLPSTPPVVMGCLSILLAQSILLLLGCASRFQAVCIFVWLTSFQHRNGIICDGQDVLMRWWIFCMIFMPLDYAWSLGRKLRGGRTVPTREPTRGERPSAWGLRLVQFQITAVYLSTAWMKWQGQSWRDGTALYYVARMDDLFGRFWLPDFLFENPWMLKPMTWGVVGLEALLPLMLWFRPTRRLAIGAAIGLHLCIEYAMHIYLFEWVMIVGVLAFVQPHEWSGMFRGWHSRRQKPKVVASQESISQSHGRGVASGL